MEANGSHAKRSVAFVTMGCAKNEVDSRQMGKLLVQSGYAVTEDVDAADVVIVNTCSFIHAATEESIEAILEAVSLPKVRLGNAKLIVAGCMPARYSDDLASELPEVSSFVACDEESQIVQRVDELFRGGETHGAGEMVGAGCATAQMRESDGGPLTAYVKISDGCNRFCSYCAIPFIRGRYHSFSLEDILADVDEQISEGAREIVLIAQDTGRWGDDLASPLTLAKLIDTLASRYPRTWFRVMYIQPEGITDELIEVVARNQNVCSYFDIPFQHCDAALLKAMNRSGSSEEFLGLIERIRTRIPDVALRTTLIAGFPGESEEQFEELCDFIEEACLDYVGVFAYSREEGTRAFDFPHQVDEEEKAFRAQRLRDIADDVSSGIVKSRVGTHQRVLICGEEEDGQLYGRAMSQAPDVDGITFVDGGDVGDVVEARIVDTMMYEMEAEVIS